ncbi:MAG TPA: SDR family oxidoreductase [Gemmatimonadales bacterium]|nr:SDR family oxidoreductase [Gemmatimonadales bacterium]
MAALAGRVAVVTGASRGIGAAVAAALRDAGARVVRLARTIPTGTHEGYHDLRCDLTDPAAVENAAQRVLTDAGVPDVVVSNAGAFLLQPLEATTPEAFDVQIAANLRGPYHVARAFLPAMRRAGTGVYVTVGSVADHVAFAGNTAYAATKYGLRGLHETLVAEFRGSGVRLTLVSPGPTDTAVWDPVDPDSRPGFIPRAAMLRPADVAEAVLFTVTRPRHVRIDWLRINPSAS